VHHLQQGEDTDGVKDGPSPTKNRPGEDTEAVSKAAGEGQTYSDVPGSKAALATQEQPGTRTDWVTC